MSKVGRKHNKACALLKGFRKKHSVVLSLILLNPTGYTTLTAQYQKKKSVEDYFQYTALCHSWINMSIYDQEDQRR